MPSLRHYAPHLVLSCTLIAEVLVLTLAFDAEELVKSHSAWARLVGGAPQYLHIAVASVFVATLLAGRQALVACAEGPRWCAAERVPFLAAHASALAAFASVTAIVFTRFGSLAHLGVWVAAWFLTGALTLGLWALAIFPLGHWLNSGVRMWRSVALGVAGGSALWASGFGTQKLWPSLAKYTFYVVGWILGLIYKNVVFDASRLVVGTGTFKVSIAPECSGFEGIGLILAFLTLYLWMSRRDLRFPGALVLLPIGVAAIWIANSLRIVALVVLGSSGWPAVARGGFHSQAGWLTFNAVGLGLAAMTTRGGYFTTGAQLAAREESPAPAYVAPLAAVLAASMITGAFSAGFDWLYPFRVFVAAAVLWMFRHHYRTLHWSWSPVSMALGFAAFVAWLMLMPDHGGREASDWPSALATIPAAGATAWLLIRITGYVVTVPIVEELAFRGFLTRRLIRPDFERVPLGAFSWVSFLIASVVFGAFHGKFWLPATAAGMIFAIALCRRGSIGDAVQAHATTNGLIALYVFWTGRWFLWS